MLHISLKRHPRADVGMTAQHLSILVKQPQPSLQPPTTQLHARVRTNNKLRCTIEVHDKI